MKRFIAITVAVLMVSVAAVQAQQKGGAQKGAQQKPQGQGQQGGGQGGGQKGGPSGGTQGYKIDKEALTDKIAKSDAAIADPKKGAKAATWIDRGDLFVDVALAPVAGVRKDMPVDQAKLLFYTNPTRSTRKVGDKTMTVLTFPYFEAYVQKDNSGQETIAFYRALPRQVLDTAATQKAYDAYDKAYQIDPKESKKVADGINQLVKVYNPIAYTAFNIGDYAAAANAFAQVYEIQRHPAVNKVDTVAAYLAGYYAVAADNWDIGLKYLQIAYDLKEYDGGEIYSALYKAYAGKKDYDSAKKILLEGYEKFPGRNDLIESLIDLYTTTGENVADLVPVLEKAVAADPKNPMLWNGLGHFYFKLGQLDKAIEAFEHVAALIPDDFNTNFNLGVLYNKLGDNMQAEKNKKSFINQDELAAANNKVLDMYAKAFPFFEKAHQLNPDDINSVEALRMLSIRLRDRPGMTDNYAKYKALYEEMSAKQQQPAAGGDAPATAPAQ